MAEISDLYKNEGMRSIFVAFPFIIYLHIFFIKWVKCEFIQMQKDDGKLCVRTYTFTTLLFSAQLIYNLRWCSVSPSNATTRSELHNEHFYLKGF